MSIKATINGTAYNNVTSLKATDGTNNATVTLAEVGTMDIPTAVKTVTENGTFDIKNFASVIVNVASQAASGGGDVTVETGSTVATEDTYTIQVKDSDVQPVFVAMVLDESTVTAYKAGYCYAMLAWKDHFNVSVKSTSTAWFGTACSSSNTGAGYSVASDGSKTSLHSPLKLYGAKYNWIIVY